MSAYDDYLDPDRAGLNDVHLDNQYFAQAFPDADGPGELYRQTYKYTACGPSVGVLITYLETVEPDGFNDYPGEVQRSKWLYCSNLYKLGTWKDMDERGELITAMCVSSIVEGVDCDTGTVEVEAKQEDEEPSEFAQRFFNAVGAVDDEASEIWNSTHGCESCAKHWHEEGFSEYKWGPFEGCDGATPVWKDCPECSGSGAII